MALHLSREELKQIFKEDEEQEEAKKDELKEAQKALMIARTEAIKSKTEQEQKKLRQAEQRQQEAEREQAKKERRGLVFFAITFFISLITVFASVAFACCLIWK